MTITLRCAPRHGPTTHGRTRSGVRIEINFGIVMATKPRCECRQRFQGAGQDGTQFNMGPACLEKKEEMKCSIEDISK